ncbi:Vgb family protein [Hyphococcus luteus]|uniref:Lyase n=1 Tax=Hyphococcus luteus TaxID=2058213 RepID=A0A2S7JZG7_9PROT|nr:lyase [Marinicaulis flavus]PQA85644.1 lyase [Marinicaulis flavus]
MRIFGAAILSGVMMMTPVFAEETVDIREWKVPFENTRPRDPFAESANSVWFVGQAGGYIGHLDASSGVIVKYDLPEGEGPHNLIVGEDGIVWYAGNRTGVIGRFDPKTKETEEIPMPDEAARDPHTLVFDEGEENIWFTVQGGNFIGRLNIESRKVDLIASKTERSRPYGIKMAPDGSVWVALFGTYKLAHINPETLELTEIDLPREGALPRRLEITSDGRVWYGDYIKGVLGVYDPEKKTFKEWEMPQGERARPYGMAVDGQDRIWMVATGVDPNIFMGFDPKTEEFFSKTDIPSGGGTIRHMHYYAPAGAVWFGADTNYVGRAVVEPPVTD